MSGKFTIFNRSFIPKLTIMKIKYKKEIHLSDQEAKELFELSNFALKPHIDTFKLDKQSTKAFYSLSFSTEVYSEMGINEILSLTKFVGDIIEVKLNSMQHAEANMEDVAQVPGVITRPKQYALNMIETYKKQLNDLKRIEKIITEENSNDDND